ncbi:hypothetical protein Ais01nite_54630 [Asanoa ishikariensis]|nr:hypothetical protein Ais01nite_54630 [Asanoa ishikariensis]
MTIAFWLQLAAVLMLLGLLGLIVGHAVYFDELISRAVELVPDADPDEVNGERVGNVVTTVIPGVIILVVAVWLAATAIPVLRGSNVGRIFVFIAGGAHLLLCASPFVAGAAIIPLFIASGPAYEPEYVPEDIPQDGFPPDDIFWEDSKFYDTLYSDTTPAEDAFFAGQAAVTVVEVVLVLAVVVLLAVPPAYRWFVPRPALQPLPVGPYAGYPAALPYVICPDPSVHVPPSATPPATPPVPPPA